MSKTYDLVCHTCKESLWIAQSNEQLYTTETHLKNLSEFLFNHQQHSLEFGEDEKLDCCDYMTVGKEDE